MSKEKAHGLVLDLGGAPDTWHAVQGVYGMFHPTEPTPVGGQFGEVPLEEAKRLDKDPGCPLKLVEIKTTDVPDLRTAAAEARKAQQRGPTKREE